MKKSLLALAAMGAFAGAAQAQSSVTVYGILDVGYIGGNERVAGPTIAGNQVNQRTFNQIGSSAQSTSRLGFRGVEDLGGGTRAFFTLETQIQPNEPTFSSLQTRAAFVGLGQKGIGQVTIGTQNTLVTDAMSPTLTGQYNNIVGSLLFPSRTGPFGLTNSSTTNNANNANGNQDAFTFRTSNTIKLQSDRVAGFVGSAMLVMNDTNSTQNSNVGANNTGYTGGKDNANGWGLGLNFAWKKLIVTGAYQSLKSVDPYVLSSTGVYASGAPAAWGSSAPTPGVNVTDNQAYVGATYDFGVLKAYAGWIDRKVTNQVNANQYAKRTAQEIGVRANLTKTVEGWASVGNGRVNAFGQGQPTANINGFQLGANYLLSKRTNLYAIYGQAGTSNASGSATGVTRSYNSSNYALGVRHTF